MTTELGARPYAPQDLYRSYIEQSQIFIGIYGSTLGPGVPGAPLSNLEEEYILSEGFSNPAWLKTVKFPESTETIRAQARREVDDRARQRAARLDVDVVHERAGAVLGDGLLVRGDLTVSGQFRATGPCWETNASTQRSHPKATQPLCATSPAASSRCCRPHDARSPRCSRRGVRRRR